MATTSHTEYIWNWSTPSSTYLELKISCKRHSTSIPSTLLAVHFWNFNQQHVPWRWIESFRTGATSRLASLWLPTSHLTFRLSTPPPAPTCAIGGRREEGGENPYLLHAGACDVQLIPKLYPKIVKGGLAEQIIKYVTKETNNAITTSRRCLW